MTTSSPHQPGDTPCLAKNDDYLCTLDRGHPGEHEAHDGFEPTLAASWESESRLQCADWCSLPPDHELDESDGERLHYGPSFGGLISIAAESSRGLAPITISHHANGAEYVSTQDLGSLVVGRWSLVADPEAASRWLQRQSQPPLPLCRSIDHDALQNRYEEDHETTLRLEVGVRPTWHYDSKDRHPDIRPCPSCCYVADAPHEHDIITEHPTTARHALGCPVATIASRYQGERLQLGANWVSQTATVLIDLDQMGQNEPEVTVNLRHHPEGQHTHEEKLRLSLDDARDLVKALQYVIAQAEQ